MVRTDEFVELCSFLAQNRFDGQSWIVAMPNRRTAGAFDPRMLKYLERIALIHGLGEDVSVKHEPDRDIRSEEFRVLTETFLDADFDQKKLGQIEGLQIAMLNQQNRLLEMLEKNEVSPEVYVDQMNASTRDTFEQINGLLGADTFLRLFGEGLDHIPYIEKETFLEEYKKSHPSAPLEAAESLNEEDGQAAITATHMRFVKSMAEHIAHEIGNALVPISTHQQLFKDSAGDPEFQESLGDALSKGVKRITRLANQMVFLARDWHGDFGDAVNVADLIVEAFHEAHAFHPGKKVAQLSFDQKAALWKVKADSKALRHAFSEIMLNALQANPENPIVAVNLEERRGEDHVLTVEVQDRGKGFTKETAKRASEPFFTTRSEGLGIGLTVSQRIIESHQGSIEIRATREGIVRISLPLDEQS